MPISTERTLNVFRKEVIYWSNVCNLNLMTYSETLREKLFMHEYFFMMLRLYYFFIFPIATIKLENDG